MLEGLKDVTGGSMARAAQILGQSLERNGVLWIVRAYRDIGPANESLDRIGPVVAP
jgi:hypothetical protein